MYVTEGLEPAPVFRFFEEICNIPHISNHERELSDYCVRFAKERGLFYRQDEMGNVIIIGEASKGREDAEPIMLQGHLDMVGDKLPSCRIDLEKEPIRLRRDGDYLTADGTTLGGDDGIAVAFGLALLDAKDIPHPRLELVLTVGEEVGLLGASAIDLSCCRANRLLNMDSEEEGVFTAGCCGGIRVDLTIPAETETKRGVVCEVRTDGFLGGHSGIEIGKGRANANVAIGRFLLFLKERAAADIISIGGGVKDNVIPKHAAVKLLAAAGDLSALKEALLVFNGYLAAEFAVSDPDARLVLETGEEETCDVLCAASKEKAVTALNLAPNGVQAMSMDLPGLVETSLNLGTVRLGEEGLCLCFSVRSSLESAKAYLRAKLEQLATALGGTAFCHGDYPGWEYARESKLRELCQKVYREQQNKEARVEVIHAGLECGVLASKIEGLDCLSIGPDMYDVHTPDEKISIPSICRVWEFLKAVLDNC